MTKENNSNDPNQSGSNGTSEDKPVFDPVFIQENSLNPDITTSVDRPDLDTKKTLND